MKNKTAIFLLSLIVAAGVVCFPLFQASAKDTITVGFPMSRRPRKAIVHLQTEEP